MKNRIYLSGSINGAYRAQNIIKVLSDSNIKYWHLSGYSIFDVSTIRGVSFISKILWQLPLFFIKLVVLLRCTHVIVLPMNFSILTLVDVFIARIFNKKIIVDYYISLYDTLINDRKTTNNTSMKARWYKFKDRYLLKLATDVIFLNNAESEFYQRIAGVSLPAEKCRIIPLCIDYRKEMFAVEGRCRGDDDDFNVCWWGTYIPLHGLEKVIDAFQHIDDSKVKLYVFGNSDKAAGPYRKKVKDLKLESRIFITNDMTFSNGRLGEFLISRCDLAIGNFGDSEKAKTVLVNKLVDAISLNIPCLTQKTLATGEFFVDGEALKYSEATPQEIAVEIIKLKNDPEKLIEIKSMARSKYLSLFSPDVFKTELLKLL